MGVWVVGHVEPVFVVAAICIAGCLLLVAVHVGHIGVEPRLRFQGVECLGFDGLSADEKSGRSNAVCADAVCADMYVLNRRSGNPARGRMDDR
jgi:hypothetical protein